MPDILSYFSRMAHYNKAMFESDPSEPLRLMENALKVLHLGPSLNRLKLTSVPPGHMEVLVVVGAAFATNTNKSSQLGVLAMISDAKTKVVNVIHFISSKSKRIFKSALAAEEKAWKGVTDSFSLYGLVVSMYQTTEHRLQIDLVMLREALENREISSVIWAAGSENPADDLTKPEKRSGNADTRSLFTTRGRTVPIFHPALRVPTKYYFTTTFL